MMEFAKELGIDRRLALTAASLQQLQQNRELKHEVREESIIKKEYTFYAILFRKQYGHAETMVEIFTDYDKAATASKLRRMLKDHLGAYRAAAFPESGDDITRVEATKAMDTAHFAMCRELKQYGPLSPDVASNGQIEHTDAEKILLELGIAHWTPSHFKIAMNTKLHLRLQPIQELELRLRAEQLEKEQPTAARGGPEHVSNSRAKKRKTLQRSSNSARGSFQAESVARGFSRDTGAGATHGHDATRV
jgi:hypothetical protein